MSHKPAKPKNHQPTSASIQEYQDIINLTRPLSKRPKMSLANRAAQFMPFAAIEGHKDVVHDSEGNSIYPDVHYTAPEETL